MTHRGVATRARLLEATRHVVRTVGYAHATTRAIALEAGVAEGTIYRHFPDKAALFFAAVLDGNRPVIDHVAKLPSRAGQGTVAANLTDCLGQLATLRDQILPLELAMLTDPELIELRRRAVTGAMGPLPEGPPEYISAYLAAEQQLGRVRPDVDPREASMVLLATTFALSLVPAQAGTGSAGHLLGVAVAMLLGGIEP